MNHHSSLFSVRKLVICAVFIALGLLFPMFFHLIGLTAGQIFLPMHIPVLICGFVCGPVYGLVCGLLTPLLSFLITQMPPLVTIAVSMSLELATYAFVSGFLYRRLGKLRANIFISLLCAMLAGRVVGGICSAVTQGQAFAVVPYLTLVFVTALPGIAIQLVLIPIVVLGLRRAKLIV